MSIIVMFLVLRTSYAIDEEYISGFYFVLFIYLFQKIIYSKSKI